MTKTQKIIGTSLFSLLLVCVGMFMVCSGRSARVGNEEDYASQEELDEQYRNDLLSKLEFLESQGGFQQNDENPQANPDDPVLLVTDAGDIAGADTSTEPVAGQGSSAESFLTPELFSNMQSEIDQLQTISFDKERDLQAARGELRDVETRVAAAETNASIRRTPSSSTRQRVSSPPIAEVDSETSRQYQSALDDYYSRNYDGAIEKFATMLGRNDNNSLADNCQYWIGESYFAKGDFYQAAAEFHKVYTFSDANKQDDAQLMIGLSFLKAGERDLAMREFAEVMTYSKNPSAAKRAERYIRQLEQV
jgi:TolA-binding protein